MKITSVALDQLHIDPANVRTHPQRNLDTIKASLARFGQQKPIVVDSHGVVRAGNGTLEAARALGWEKLDVVRTGLEGSEATAYSITDNRTAELAEWDDDSLAATLEALQAEEFDLDELGWNEDELADLLGDEPGEPAEDPGAQLDRAAELQAKWGTARGQLWQIGEHRLLCGDSTKAEDVRRVMGGSAAFLMITDPPYGVDYKPGWRDGVVGEFGAMARERNAVTNDEIIDWSPAYELFTGDVAYVWHSSCFAIEVGSDLKKQNFQIRASIIWCKQHFAISRGHYHWQHEPCWYAVRTGRTARWCGDRTQSTIWDIASLNPAGRQEERFTHGAQKPVECMARPMRNHGETGDNVYDPFLGSGTTMVAAEQTGRRCYGLEIEPKYVAVSLERLAGMGLEPLILR